MTTSPPRWFWRRESGLMGPPPQMTAGALPLVTAHPGPGGSVVHPIHLVHRKARHTYAH